MARAWKKPAENRRSHPNIQTKVKRAYNKMGNGRVARGLAMLQGARRENILYGSSTDEQRRSSGKDRQLEGVFWRINLN
jgi:hypothetical protein